MPVGIGQLLHGVFEQCAALAQPKHFIAQHAVGGGGILQAFVGQALVAAQGVEQLLGPVPALLLRLGGLDLGVLVALPCAPPEKQRRAHGHDRHDEQQPGQGETSRRSGHVGHSGILGRSRQAQAPQSSATAWRVATDTCKLCLSPQFSKVAAAS